MATRPEELLTRHAEGGVSNSRTIGVRVPVDLMVLVWKNGAKKGASSESQAVILALKEWARRKRA